MRAESEFTLRAAHIEAPAQLPDLISCWLNSSTKKTQYPKMIHRRHIVVEVVDGAGAPVKGAQVVAASEQGQIEFVDNPKLVVNAQGRTPGKGENKAILLTQSVMQATDTADKPAFTAYTYEIKASATGFKDAAVKNVSPDESWKIIKVVLSK